MMYEIFWDHYPPQFALDVGPQRAAPLQHSLYQGSGYVADYRGGFHARPFEYLKRKEVERRGSQSLLVFLSGGFKTFFQLLIRFHLSLECGS